ncbi:MAG: TnpV protein [Verrucomicrobiota bacterium]|nr:TnpV protein [Verrucomicrobiota bacterium]
MLKRNGKVAARDEQLSLFDFAGSNEEAICLTQYGLMAKRHWQEFRPTMYRKLEAEGKLEEALFEAQETTIDEMEALTRTLEREQKLTPQPAETQAWEMIREKCILLPPEGQSD